MERRIQVLPPGVAERIAAGEVIERPASVVKELIENSIDAGATEVAVLLEEGGKSLIEVLDNGFGMVPEDLTLCIERHATSKLSTLEDLEKIHTLGFRGEALPSVAAVADLSILSRAKGASTAYEISLTSLGKPQTPEPKTFGHFLNSPHGTRIQARGLFSQVPARLKFLKSQGAEVSQVREWIERLALAHPGTGFRLVADGRSVLTLRPQSEADRVRALLADNEDYPLISGSNDLGFRDRSEGSLHIRAHWLQGLSSPQTRRLIQVVNGRAVRDRVLQQALLMPFRQALLPGQFPAVALFIEIDPAEIDVNVHPTKTEVRFLDSRSVFKAVEEVIDGMISRNGAPTYARSHPIETQAEVSSWRAAQPHYQPMAFELPITQKSTELLPSLPSISSSPSHTPPSDSTLPQKPTPSLPDQLQEARFIGIAFQTYLFYDLGNELVLIDQHAAHERIRYETLRSSYFSANLSGNTPDSQALLIPEAVRFPSDSRPSMETRLPWLTQLGFDVEVFGEDTLLFRSIPSAWGTQDLRTRLKNLADRVLAVEEKNTSELKSLSMDETLFESLASEACHSAIRAGDPLEKAEATALVQQLFQCDHPWNCPHGRPTVVRVPQSRIEEWFQRRV